MKKSVVFLLIAALLLAGCAAQAPVPVEPPPAEPPDLDAIVQQSVDEAMARYEEEQRSKDAEIEALKEQLAVLTAQAEEGTSEPAPEETAEPPEPAPAEGTAPESEQVPRQKRLGNQTQSHFLHRTLCPR